MFNEKSPEVKRFCELLEAQRRALYIMTYKPKHPELVNNACTVTTKEGRKYINVDVGRSGYFMVVKETGEIFGIKAYGVIHRGHKYGTLATINEWYWGNYSPQVVIL